MTEEQARAGSADEELVRQAQAGDDRAMHELHRRYYDGLFALALRRLRDETRARDAVQEAFADAFLAIRRFRGRSKFSTWLFKVAQSRIIRQQEQAGREPGPASRIDAEVAGEAGELCARSVEELADERQAYLEVLAMIQRLEPAQSAALTLRFVVGLSLAETAQVLGISEAAAGMRISRGRERLKGMLLRRRDGQA